MGKVQANTGMISYTRKKDGDISKGYLSQCKSLSLTKYGETEHQNQ